MQVSEVFVFFAQKKPGALTPGNFFEKTVIDTFCSNNLSLTVFVVQSSSNRLCFDSLSLTVFHFPNFPAISRADIASGQFSDRRIFVRPLIARVWSLLSVIYYRQGICLVSL